MSPIALILNLLLGGLLVAALALGLRLDRRLRALRESQAGFIKAVNDLDQAAARTHAGPGTVARRHRRGARTAA